MKRYRFLALWITLCFTHFASAQEFIPADYIMNNSQAMRVTKLRIPLDSVILNSISLPVEISDPELQPLISSMYRTVTDSLSLGVGIAAPQVGVNKRVILVQRFDRSDEPFEAYLNPTVIQYSVLTEFRSEGCLSVENFRCEVERPYAILINYFTVKGEYRLEMVEGFTARIFQHEIDHLNGILFPERVNLN